MKGTGAYPKDWKDIAKRIKDEAGWKCVRCGRPHDPKAGYCLTVHHLDGNKSNCAWWNCVPLDQRCHLQIQAKVVVDRPWVMAEHTAWFRIYAAGFYAQKYLGLDLTREETEARLDELLGLERAAVLGGVP